jgi:hypothetical protein
MLPAWPNTHWSLRNEKDDVIWATGSFHNAFDGMYARPTPTPTMIIRPSPRKLWRRYELVEFDVPGHVNVKRYRVDITLDFAREAIADKLGSQLREAKRISDTRFTP